MGKKHKIEYDREGCIGAAACAAVAPKFFEMDVENKAVLLDGKLNPETKKFERIIESDEDIVLAKESEDVCPVNVIKIKLMELAKKKEEEQKANGNQQE
ncbi:ferredoxin [Candidatus Woesearchaeota archaeon]|nr:ferredoxin [Candidatus Woesearchaeota archaeon]